jgi:hypothetical protein
LRVSATFTAELLRGPLAFWLETLELNHRVSFADYGQVLQECLDPTSESNRNGSGGMNVFLIRPSDLRSALAETGQAIAALAARSSATALVLICPDQNPVSDLTPLTAPLAGLANLDLVTAESLADLYPVTAVFDPESDLSGNIPYTDPIFVAAATKIVRSLSLRSRPPVKVLALDADNTLWHGICGEDERSLHWGTEVIAARHKIEEGGIVKEDPLRRQRLRPLRKRSILIA